MKKTYTKPEIMFENFSLSTNVAAGCSVITKNFGEGACAYTVDAGAFGTMQVFTPDMPTICTTTWEDGEKLCYHVSADTSSLFTS